MSMVTLIFSGVVFFGTYILIASEKIHKTAAALLGAMLMLLVVLPGPHHADTARMEKLTETLSSEKAIPEALQKTVREAADGAARYASLDAFSRYSNFDVIFTLAGMMILVNILSMTGLFQYVAILCTKVSRGSPTLLMVLLVIATAVLSAFLDNVTTILLVAPVTLVVTTQLRVPAVPFLMAETMASNIGGTATLIGDPPNLIVGDLAHFSFLDFLVNLTPFVAAVLLLYCLVLWVFYRKKMHVTVENRARIRELKTRSAITDPYNLWRGGIVMILTIVGFLLHGLIGIQPSLVAMAGATLALCVCQIDVAKALEKIEWETLFFFMGLFILVKGAELSGLLAHFGLLLDFTASWNPVATILAVMWVSAIAAAIMNNVSFTAAMAAMVAVFLRTAPAFRDAPELQEMMWWGLALAVCLGGNGTIVGAAANMVVAGIGNKAGEKITSGVFLKYGLPVMLVSMILASVYIVMRCDELGYTF